MYSSCSTYTLTFTDSFSTELVNHEQDDRLLEHDLVKTLPRMSRRGGGGVEGGITSQYNFMAFLGKCLLNTINYIVSCEWHINCLHGCFCSSLYFYPTKGKGKSWLLYATKTRCCLDYATKTKKSILTLIAEFVQFKYLQKEKMLRNICFTHAIEISSQNTQQ